MNKAQCPICGGKADDSLPCHDCTGHLVRDLHVLQELWPELSTSIKRQARAGSDSGKASSERPMLFHDNAARVRDSVINTISTWIRELDMGDLPEKTTMHAWCEWLLARTQRIRGHGANTEIIDEIRYAAGIVKSAVDPHANLIFVQKCDLCGKEVRAGRDAEVAVCRSCLIYGGPELEPWITYPVPIRSADRWKQAEDRLLTRSQLFEALGYYRLPIKPPTFRSWIHRGYLAPEDNTPAGQPLYRLKRALELARSPEIPKEATA